MMVRGVHYLIPGIEAARSFLLPGRPQGTQGSRRRQPRARSLGDLILFPTPTFLNRSPTSALVQLFLEPHMAPISPPRESRNTAMPQCGGGGGARGSCSCRGRGIAGLGNPRYIISRLPARAQSFFFFLELPAESPRGIGCRVLPDSGVLTATHCATTPLLLCCAPDRSSANGIRFGHPGPPQMLQCVACQHKGDGGARRGEMESARRELLTSA